MTLCNYSVLAIEYPCSSLYTFASKSTLNSFNSINYTVSIKSSNQTHFQSKFITPNRIINMSDTYSSFPVENGVNGSIDSYCTEIIIVRHGETDWNAIGKLQGQLDVELNEIGRQQAVKVAERLSKESNIAAIYSSDLQRALVTAQIIASKCGLEVITDKGIRERHLGDLQGHVYQEIAKFNPKAYEAFKSHRSDQQIPGGGESLDQLYERCSSFLQRIGEKHRGQRVIVVSHGGAIRSMYNWVVPRGRHPGKLLNTSVGVIELTGQEKWAIKSWNDGSHLSQTQFLESAFGGDASSG